MDDLAVITVFVTFFAVLGPPKVLIAFAHVSRGRTAAELRRIIVISSLAAAAVGIVIAYTADLLTSFFHVSDQSLSLAGGIIFFVYAVALVLGTHLGGGEPEEEEPGVVGGLRELLLPYIVSPLAISAELVESLDENTWSWRTTVAAMYVAVVVIDFVCVLVLVPLLPRIHITALEVLSRVLGLLLAAVGVEVFLHGLEGLGVHLAKSTY